jgi:hypothetical protein
VSALSEATASSPEIRGYGTKETVGQPLTCNKMGDCVVWRMCRSERVPRGLAEVTSGIGAPSNDDGKHAAPHRAGTRHSHADR